MQFCSMKCVGSKVTRKVGVMIKILIDGDDE